MNKQANIEFEKKILKLIKDNLKGFPATGAIGTGLVGSGTGGTIGLVKAIQRQNDGEMDDMDMKSKIKEYAKEVFPRAGIGAVAGAGTGVGLGLAGKELLSRKLRSKLLDPLKKIDSTMLDHPEVQQMYSDEVLNNPMYKLDLLNNLKKSIAG
jgi:hypothetical protein